MDFLLNDPRFQDKEEEEKEKETAIQQCRSSITLEAVDQLRGLFTVNGGSSISSRDSGRYYYIPTTTTERQQASTAGEEPLFNTAETALEKIPRGKRDIEDQTANSEKTVLYLAYGSNLAADVFLGNRGIKPLSHVKVLVPELRLTFDIPGLPYWEPCFASVRSRRVSDGEDVIAAASEEDASEKSRLLTGQGYHKDRWHKPLVGLVYEVTLSDYAKIIATEGGGQSYRDVVVTCYPFSKDYDAADPVPDYPITKPFLAHTLLSPGPTTDNAACLKPQKAVTAHSRYTVNPPGVYLTTNSTRPDPSYAQPSARYLNLISTGAAENDFPLSYRAYLADIRPYRATTIGQRIGQITYLVAWGPWLAFVIFLTSVLAGPDGRSPPWLAKMASIVLKSIWDSYDGLFRKMCGDGERTVGDT